MNKCPLKKIKYHFLLFILIILTYESTNCHFPLSENIYINKKGKNSKAQNSSGTNNMATGPNLISATLRDINGNGRIDAVDLVFDRPMKDSSFIAGQWIFSGNPGTGIDTLSAPDDNTVRILYSPDNLPVDTSVKGAAISYLNGTSVRDITGNYLAAINNVVETDGAAPVILNAISFTGSTNLAVTFSEPVGTSNFCTGNLVTTDFVYNNVSAGGASSITGFTDANGLDKTVVLTANSPFNPGDFGTDTISAATGEIFDAANLNALPAAVVLTQSAWTTQLLGAAGAVTGAYKIAVDNDNIYVTGYTEGSLDGQTLTGIRDLFLVKYSTNGVKQWTRLLGAGGAETKSYGIVLDPSGNIYLTGYTTGNLDGLAKTGTADLFIVKYNANGGKLWTRLLGAPLASTYSCDMTIDTSGYIYLTGYTNGNLDGQAKTGLIDQFIVKYNSSGGLKQWTRLLGVPLGNTYSIDTDTDSSGYIYTTGYTDGNLDGQTKTGLVDLYVTKYDSSGARQWTRLLGTAGCSTVSTGIIAGATGGIYTTGYTNGSLDGQAKTGLVDFYVVRYDSSGARQWTRLFGAAGADTRSFCITADTSGNIYPAGATTGNLGGQTVTGTTDMFTVKYDPTGTRLWTRLLGAAGSDTKAYGIASDPSCNIYPAGYTNGNLDGKILTGVDDLFIAKYDSNGARQ